MRSGKALPLYAKVRDAGAPCTVVLHAGAGVEVLPTARPACAGATLISSGTSAASRPAYSGAQQLEKRIRPGDLTWQSFMQQAEGMLASGASGSSGVFEPYVPPAGACGTTATNILFSSGTTVRAGWSHACSLPSLTSEVMPCSLIAHVWSAYCFWCQEFARVGCYDWPAPCACWADLAVCVCGAG